MGKRRTSEQIQCLVREADRNLAKGLTVAETGIAKQRVPTAERL